LQSGRDIKHTFPSSAQVKNEWSYNYTKQFAFMAFTFTFY